MDPPWRTLIAGLAGLAVVVGLGQLPFPANWPDESNKLLGASRAKFVRGCTVTSARREKRGADGKIGSMSLRWASYRCPSCGAYLESRMINSARVGLECKKCGKCGAEYRTPDREWQNMTKGQRVSYFLSEWTVGWIGVFILGGAILSDNGWLGGFYGLAAGCVWCAPSWIGKSRRVKHSVARSLAQDRMRGGPSGGRAE